jgi:hypothetical protein
VWTYRRHHSLPPLLLTIAAAVLVYAALYGPLDHGIGVSGGHGAQHGTTHDAMTTAAGSHGGISATVLVWIGLGLLLAAQVWDRAARSPLQSLTVAASLKRTRH